MKILTLNINSIRAHAESFIDILRAGEYDTILVQELKVETAGFPHNLFDEYGYNVKVLVKNLGMGLQHFQSILSKTQPLVCRIILTQTRDLLNALLMDACVL